MLYLHFIMYTLSTFVLLYIQLHRPRVYCLNIFIHSMKRMSGVGGTPGKELKEYAVLVKQRESGSTFQTSILY